MKHHTTLIYALCTVLCVTMIVTTLIGQRTPKSIALPPDATVTTTNPKAAVHTRLTGVADHTYVTTQLDLVAQLGTPWIIELFPWAYAQPRSAYGYDWSGFDVVVDHAHARGLRIIARLDIVPQWARASGSSDRLLLTHRYNAYRDYVVAFVTRYQHRGVSHIIIWNEPNLRFEWGGRTPNPEAYAQLMATVYPAVKAVAPAVTVIAGALSPGPTLGDNGEVRIGDREYAERFLAAGGGAFMDAWGVHAYGGQFAATAPPTWDEVNIRRTELVHAQISRYVDVPIYVTEGGWNDASRWELAVTPAQRIRWSIDAYALAAAWPWAHTFALWQFGLPTPTRTYHDGWNLVAADGTPRAIYSELQRALGGTPR